MIRTRIAELFLSVKFNTTQRLLGRWSPGKGYGEEIAIGEGLVLENGVLKAPGGGSGGTPASDAEYDATAWNGVTAPPTKNAVRDKLVAMDAQIALSVKSDITGIPGAVPVPNQVALTRAQYAAIVTPDPATQYIITDDPEPMPAALTRTAAEGTPNGPDQIVVTGITAPGGRNPLNFKLISVDPLSGRGGYQSYSPSTDFNLFWDSGSWIITNSATYNAELVSDALSPVGLSGWAVTTGAGSPAVTSTMAPASTPIALGQVCLLGGPLTTNRIPFIAISISPPRWEIGGGFAKDATSFGTLAPGTYKKIIFDGTSITHENYPLS